MASHVKTHEEQVAELVAAGLSRVQAERHLAAERGDDISDLKPVDDDTDTAA